ncbi:hypothetical protein DCAR_0100561 [Daucus carota subsp. sativus]|uniref:Uncharacterized protein n=1 Tax=Daucus carota subsp. sativus TaxID=79200 RepID=A0A162AZK7_DAUCS|nr:hypothetical protein DCAR_0100561 [Daucus carota subsp. sativus]
MQTGKNPRFRQQQETDIKHTPSRKAKTTSPANKTFIRKTTKHTNNNNQNSLLNLYHTPNLKQQLPYKLNKPRLQQQHQARNSQTKELQNVATTSAPKQKSSSIPKR